MTARYGTASMMKRLIDAGASRGSIETAVKYADLSKISQRMLHVLLGHDEGCCDDPSAS